MSASANTAKTKTRKWKVGDRFRILGRGWEKDRFEILEVKGDGALRVKNLYNPGYSPMMIEAFQLQHYKDTGVKLERLRS